MGNSIFKTNRLRGILTVCLVLIGCTFMYYVENILQPQYIIKSLYKIGFFCGAILIYSLILRENIFVDFFRVKDKKKLKRILFLGILAYLLIIALYIILARYIDLNNIKNKLEIKEGITKNNSIPIFLYISIINSFLEEMFFRGFAFLQLKKYCNIKATYFFSAISFSLYHLAILNGWFNPGLFLVVLILLIFCGLILDYLNTKYENIYFSWILHMFSNLSINTIGIFMFI